MFNDGRASRIGCTDSRRQEINEPQRIGRKAEVREELDY